MIRESGKFAGIFSPLGTWPLSFPRVNVVSGLIVLCPSWLDFAFLPPLYDKILSDLLFALIWQSFPLFSPCFFFSKILGFSQATLPPPFQSMRLSPKSPLTSWAVPIASPVEFLSLVLLFKSSTVVAPHLQRLLFPS